MLDDQVEASKLASWFWRILKQKESRHRTLARILPRLYEQSLKRLLLQSRLDEEGVTKFWRRVR